MTSQVQSKPATYVDRGLVPHGPLGNVKDQRHATWAYVGNPTRPGRTRIADGGPVAPRANVGRSRRTRRDATDHQLGGYLR